MLQERKIRGPNLERRQKEASLRKFLLQSEGGTGVAQVTSIRKVCSRVRGEHVQRPRGRKEHSMVKELKHGQGAEERES